MCRRFLFPLLLILGGLCCAVSKGDGNLIPPAVSALDDPIALDGIRYLQVGKDYNENPSKYLRILTSGTYAGKGCLEFTSFNPTHGPVLFLGATGDFDAGRILTASAYVRAPARTRLYIFIWTDNGDLILVEQIGEGAEIGHEWRQIKVTGVLTKPCSRISVMLRVNPIEMETKYTVQVDDVRLEEGREASSSSRTPIGSAPSLASFFSKIKHVVPRTEEEPDIDGVIQPAEWDRTPVMSGFTLRDREGTRAPQLTLVRMQYDAERLFVAAWCEESNQIALRSGSTVRDRPDWGDDRIEFFFSVLSIPQAPTFYISINSFGVLCDQYIGSTQSWDPELTVAAGRTEKAWTLEFSLPFRDVGISDPINTVWRLNIGRHHRASCNASSQLIRHEQGFHEPAYFENMLFAGSEESGPVSIVLLSRGEMSPIGNRIGTNSALYWVENGSGAPLDLLFRTTASVPGGEAKQQELSRRIDATSAIVEQPYRILSRDGETLTFRVIQEGNTDQALFESACDVARLQPYRNVESVHDPLFEELLDRSRPRPDRMRWHITWPMPLSGLTYQSAIQFGCTNSYDAMYAQLSEAGLCVLSHYVPDLPCVEGDWKERFASRWNPDFELLAGLAQKAGRPGPILYANYDIIGLDDEDNAGTNFTGSGFLPDPANRRAFVRTARVAVETFGASIRAVCVGDEQFARQIHLLEKYMAETSREQCPFAFLIAADERAREEHGFGQYGFPWGMSTGDPEYPFCRRVMYLWLCEELRQANVEMAHAVREVVPGMIIVGEDGHHGTTLSLETQHHYADVVTAQLQHALPDDYTYDVKRMRDLSGIHEIKPVPHDLDAGFPHGGLQADELRELYSQMLRGGATGFHFWPASYGSKSPTPPYMGCVSQGHPFAWEMALNVSKLVNHLPQLRRPGNSTAGIFISRNTQLCSGRTGAGGDYAIFELLGPQYRGWFDFVSDAQLSLGTRHLKDFRFLIVPDATYADRVTVDTFLQFCSQGGVLLSGDPSVLETNVDGTPLADSREALFGVTLGEGTLPLGDIVFDEGSSLGTGILPADDAAGELPSVVSIAEDAIVHARFENGVPAIVEKKHGSGRAIYVDYPFCDRTAFSDTGWRDLVLHLYEATGGTSGHDIWRFSLPESVVPGMPELPTGKCLTGNGAFWYQYRLVRSAGNVDTGGSYTIVTGRQKRTDTFSSGRLTDRLRLIAEPDLAVAPKGYAGYLDFKVEPWVETISGKEPSIVTFDFDEAYPLSRCEVFYIGMLNAISADVSSNCLTWTPVGGRTQIPATGFREIGQISMKFEDEPRARFLRLVLVPGDTTANISLVETEVWGE